MNEHQEHKAPEQNPEHPTPSRPPAKAPLKSLQSLELLRDRIEQAAFELKRLRQENQALTHRIHALETRHAAHPDQTQVTLDEPPQALEQKVKRFIKAIDQYLNEEVNPAPEA